MNIKPHNSDGTQTHVPGLEPSQNPDWDLTHGLGLKPSQNSDWDLNPQSFN